ncbi:hypothetical protein IGI39_000382 [Enterococcus sp. AZ135]|uniref:DUF2922 family protein n=1 Tax=unclassified Enterococcus TaxID=2608891 RepID=UPI003F28B99C
MISTVTLDAEFENSNGKSHHFYFKNFDATKTGEQIRSALEKLTKLSLFEKDGVQLFKKVKHATIIEERETEVFDESAKFESQPKVPKDPLSTLMNSVAAAPVSAPVELATESTPIKTEETLEHVRIPEDLRIAEERPAPDRLIQTIELPRGIDPWSLNEEQAIAVISACLPEHATPINLDVDDQSVPAKLLVTAIVEAEERAAPASVQESAPEATKSPPVQPKKKRKRLLDRIRKRE